MSTNVYKRALADEQAQQLGNRQGIAIDRKTDIVTRVEDGRGNNGGRIRVDPAAPGKTASDGRYSGEEKRAGD